MNYPADVIAAAQATGRPNVPKGPFPSATLAQWRLESKNGASVSGKNNYFGIKATKAQIDAGQATSRWTKEFIGGKYISEQQWFADYPSVQSGFAAHTALLMTPHYHDCQDAQTALDYCRALQANGYATAPTYAQTLISIIQSDNLTQYDNPLPAEPATNPGAGQAVPAASGVLSGAAPPKETSMGSFLSVLTTLLSNVPAEISIAETAVSDLTQAASGSGVSSFISLVESLFHISAPTAGSATVIEPKTTHPVGSAGVKPTGIV